MKPARTIAAVVSLAGLTVAATADPYAPPASYYAGVTGTGATLKSQLTSAMSAGHIQRNYGTFRNAAVLYDTDPNNPGNILLAYNRASVSGSWDSGSTWNREHVWPQSLQPGSASNSSTGNLGDPHALRPCNPGINSSRGNKPFGFETTTGSFGSVGSYYFPGDTDKGDIARSLFYSDTRWSSLGLSIVTSFPGSNQMGDRDSLVAWNYAEPPDEFERRRNHMIYSQADNPNYYTNNRNAYIDNPWFVWSVYMNQANDSRISVGGMPLGNGASFLDVTYDDALVSTPLNAVTITIDKDGNDGTYFEVIPDANVTASLDGKYNAFPVIVSGSDSRTMDVNFGPGATDTPGLVMGQIVIDNLDITTAGGSGRGDNDADDIITLIVNVLDHANASFDSVADQNTLTLDLGTITVGSGPAVMAFDIYNLGGSGDVAAVDIEFNGSSGNTGKLSTTLVGADALQESQMFLAALSDTSAGSFSATYTYRTYDDRSLDNALEGDLLTLNLTGEVIPVSCDGDYNNDLMVDFDDLNIILQDWGNPYDFNDLNDILQFWLTDCGG